MVGKKNGWMVGWIGTINGYKNGILDGQKKWMVGWIKIYLKIDGWLNGYTFFKDRWMVE